MAGLVQMCICSTLSAAAFCIKLYKGIFSGTNKASVHRQSALLGATGGEYSDDWVGERWKKSRPRMRLVRYTRLVGKKIVTAYIIFFVVNSPPSEILGLTSGLGRLW